MRICCVTKKVQQIFYLEICLIIIINYKENYFTPFVQLYLSFFFLSILNVTCFCEISQIIFSHLAMTSFPSDNLWCHVLYSATEWVRPLFLHMNKAYQHDNCTLDYKTIWIQWEKNINYSYYLFVFISPPPLPETPCSAQSLSEPHDHRCPTRCSPA